MSSILPIHFPQIQGPQGYSGIAATFLGVPETIPVFTESCAHIGHQVEPDGTKGQPGLGHVPRPQGQASSPWSFISLRRMPPSIDTTDLIISNTIFSKRPFYFSIPRFQKRGGGIHYSTPPHSQLALPRSYLQHFKPYSSLPPSIYFHISQ